MLFVVKLKNVINLDLNIGIGFGTGVYGHVFDKFYFSNEKFVGVFLLFLIKSIQILINCFLNFFALSLKLFILGFKKAFFILTLIGLIDGFRYKQIYKRY